jgi:phosphoribosylformylglycinamidine cyclo-ligase
MKKLPLSYADAGVDRAAADLLVDQIRKLTRSTLNSKVKGAVGGYASLYEISANQYIAATTDGVGTKLKLAFESGLHSTIGIDLVAMCVNDLICVGAEPLFFLDYFATGKLAPDTAIEVLKGIVNGCKQAGCALVGGETAEMPDFYKNGEYDLGGFAVGKVSKKDLLPKTKIRAGNILIGIASSGLHSNGFSLIRKLLDLEKATTKRASLLSHCLTPTKIYVRSMLPLIKKGLILGAAHITGSGVLNIPRMNAQVSYEITLPGSKQRAPIYDWLERASELSLSEFVQTFNAGIGMVLAVDSSKVAAVLKILKQEKENAFVCGKVISSKKGKSCLVRVSDASGNTIELKY